MPDLDKKATSVFAGKVVRKDLVRKVKVGANVPVFVLEYLLGKYCATDDPVAESSPAQVVNNTLSSNFVRPDEANKAQSFVKDKGKHTLIDKVQVRYVSDDDKHWAELKNFGNKYLHVPEHYLREYDRLLMGGIWAQVEIRRPIRRGREGKKEPVWIESLKPIQLATFDLEEYRTCRRQFTTDEWIDLMLRTVGLEPTHFQRRVKLLPPPAAAVVRAKLQPRGTWPARDREELRVPRAFALHHLTDRPNDCRELVLQHGLGKDGACRHLGRDRLR